MLQVWIVYASNYLNILECYIRHASLSLYDNFDILIFMEHIHNTILIEHGENIAILICIADPYSVCAMYVRMCMCVRVHTSVCMFIHLSACMCIRTSVLECVKICCRSGRFDKNSSLPIFDKCICSLAINQGLQKTLPQCPLK